MLLFFIVLILVLLVMVFGEIGVRGCVFIVGLGRVVIWVVFLLFC